MFRVHSLLFVFAMLLPSLSHAENTLTDSQAKSLVQGDCSNIRATAKFTVSGACDFHVLRVDNFVEGSHSIVKIEVKSNGLLYDITFTVLYGLTWSAEGGYLERLIEVKKGKVTGLSDLAKAFLKK